MSLQEELKTADKIIKQGGCYDVMCIDDNCPARRMRIEKGLDYCRDLWGGGKIGESSEAMAWFKQWRAENTPEAGAMEKIQFENEEQLDNFLKDVHETALADKVSIKHLARQKGYIKKILLAAES